MRRRRGFRDKLRLLAGQPRAAGEGDGGGSMTRPANSPPQGNKGTPTAPPPPPAWRHYLWLIALAAFLVLFFILPATRVGPGPVTLTYSRFLSDVSAHKVKTVMIPQTTGSASGTLTDGKSYTVVIPPQAGSPLLTRLEASGVQITSKAPSTSFGAEVLTWVILLLPFIIIGFIWWRFSKRAGGQLQGALGVGRSKAKVFDEERPKTTFADVAGYEGAKLEIREVVDFLRHPLRYAAAGAMAPRGVLMVGPPGTGKTLLARAVAGEASVPFFSVTGSSFVELYVGVGAARVRDLFSEARKRAPAIIFVDEIDGIGQRRGGAGAIVSNDEREQTLNQLLAEMDGFEPDTGIVVLAATNRPEVLDPALLRPGRFDRQVTIPLPTLPERAAILKVHARDKHLDPSVDLEVVARGTPGFSGADLANLVNEAAIVAVRAESRNNHRAGLRRGARPHHPRPTRGVERALARREALRCGARVGTRARRGAARRRRAGRQDHHPSGGTSARGNRAVAARRTSSL